MSDFLAALMADTRRGIATVADHSETELLEEALRLHPDDFEILVRLGELYPRLGEPDRGVAIDRRLVTLAPHDPIVRYNLACSLSLGGDADGAFDALRHAIRLGYNDVGHLLQDQDLAPLRASPLFEDILRLLRRRQREERESS